MIAIPAAWSTHFQLVSGLFSFLVHQPTKETNCMTYAVILASSLLAVVLTLAFAREVRLRKALQRLLAKLFTHWRTANGTHPMNRPHDAECGPSDTAGHGRM
jgi:hypothetical protein